MRILNGGFSGWTSAGYPVKEVDAAECESAKTLHVDLGGECNTTDEMRALRQRRQKWRDFFHGLDDIEFPLHPEVRASTDDVEHIVATSVASARNVGSTFSEPRGVLADVRSWDSMWGNHTGTILIWD